MSLQLALARGVLRIAERNWAEHTAHCPLCTAAARERKWDHLCPAGTACRRQLTESRTDVERERAADQAPVAGQEPLW